MQKPLYVPEQDLDTLLDDIISEEELDYSNLDHPEYISEYELPKLFLVEKTDHKPTWYLN